MLTSLILIAVGMLALTPVETQYSLGAPAVFLIKLPDGTQYMNVTTAQYDIGDKFNITVAIHNVTTMTAYGLTLVWNATYQNCTGNWWLSSFFMGEIIAGRWSAAGIGYVGNDYDKDKLGGILGIPLIGAFVGLGQSALKPKNNVTGDFDIVTIEFRINAYGPHGFYIWKDPVNYAPWPYAGGQPYLSYEGAFPTAVHPTYSGWLAPPVPGVKKPYDVIWAPGYTGDANALLFYPPYSPEATKTEEPASPWFNETVTVTVTETKEGFNGTTFCPITNVTIDWGDTSPLEWMAPVAGVATFTHNYTLEGNYFIKVYCYAEGMPPDLAWYNITDNLITVVPEFSAYLLIPLFLTTTIIAVVSAKMWSKRPRGRVDVK